MKGEEGLPRGERKPCHDAFLGLVMTVSKRVPVLREVSASLVRRRATSALGQGDMLRKRL